MTITFELELSAVIDEADLPVMCYILYEVITNVSTNERRRVAIARLPFYDRHLPDLTEKATERAVANEASLPFIDDLPAIRVIS